MKQVSTLLSTIVILLTMLILHTSNASAKLYMGKITMQVGETRTVEAVPPISAYTASGSFSKTGTCVAITANGSYTCKIKANYVGTGTLSYWGSVARANTWTTDIYDMYWDIEVKAVPAPDVIVAEINVTNFPDDSFRSYLLSTSYGSDSILTESEIIRITSIYVNGRPSSPGTIKSLKGIEYFTALQYLQCYDNQLTSLDVSKNTALKWLYCWNNSLTTLDVSKNTALELLACYNNSLTSLDVSKNTALVSLTCFNNNIKGTAMDNMISSLPQNSTGEVHRFRVVGDDFSNEGNVCTTTQVTVVKAKGWFPCYYDNTTNEWVEYEGSDDATGINSVAAGSIEKDAPIYNLSGQRLDKPRKGINIIGGKKVMVK